MAAELMKAGASLPVLYEQALVQRSFEAARLWGVGLLGLQRENGLVWTSITQDEKKAINYPGRDDADLVNVLSSITDADVAVIFLEQPGGKIKISWRAKPGFDVAQIALYFGGGGHQAAAGAEVVGSLQEVQDKVLEATRAIISGEKVGSENTG
jgi:phosphoesterase RecJ-like protein